MTIKRSYFHFLMGSAAVALFLANCTVKEKADDGSCDKGDKQTGCDCPGGLTGYQECNAKGVYGSCVCPDDNSNAGTGNTSTAGKTGGDEGGTSAGGTTYGGNGGTGNTSTAGDGNVAAANAGGASDGGAGGAGGLDLSQIDPDDCEGCMAIVCPKEWKACEDDVKCIGPDGGPKGQYERITECITEQRVDGNVPRDVVRACGVSIGTSPTGNFNDVWAPEGMEPTTTAILNCMATSASEEPNAAWANDTDNYDPKVTVWPKDSCAKLACTSKL